MGHAKRTYKINLVIATWSGLRRDGRIQTQDRWFAKDQSVYLRGQVHQFTTLKHNLDQITIAVPGNPKEPKEFTSALDKIPSTISDTKIEILRRPNGGHSYGSLNSVYERYRTEFDFYILLEDDYVFLLDDFDKILVEIIEEKSGDLLASTIAPGPHDIPHAPLGNFICRTSALEKIYDHFGCLPHGKTLPSKWKNKKILRAPFAYPQLGFNYAFIELGFNLVGMKERYMIAKWNVNSVSWGGPPKPDDVLIAPIQLLLDPQTYKHKNFPEDWPTKWKPWNSY